VVTSETLRLDHFTQRSLPWSGWSPLGWDVRTTDGCWIATLAVASEGVIPSDGACFTHQALWCAARRTPTSPADVR
jgi:hypothetical protein